MKRIFGKLLFFLLVFNSTLSAQVIISPALTRPVSPFDIDKTTLTKDITLPEPIPYPKVTDIQKVDYEVIKKYFQNKQYNYAKELALNYLEKTPHDADVRLVLGQIYMREKCYCQAKQEFLQIVTEYPKYVDAWVFLAEIELVQDNTYTALVFVHKGLRHKNNDPFLMIEKAKVLFALHQYAQAAALAQEVILKNCANEEAVKQANTVLESVRDVNPRYTYGLNQIGIWSLNDHVSDLRAWWDYSGVYYSRDTYLGRMAANVNYANRLGEQANQAAFEFSPILHKYIYMDLVAARATNPAIFPDYVFGGEIYFSPPSFIDMSFGEKYSQITNTYFNLYTGSVSKEIKNWWFSFRPNHYIPKRGATSTLYIGTVRRYFGTDDHYIGITVGGGKSPDLADLQTVSFIVIRNNFITGVYEFPIFDHRLIIDIGGEYQRWVYPTGLVRKLKGGLVGMKYRFSFC